MKWVVLKAPLNRNQPTYVYGWRHLFTLLDLSEWAGIIGDTYFAGGGAIVETCTGTEITPIPADLISIPTSPHPLSLPSPPISAGFLFHPVHHCTTPILSSTHPPKMFSTPILWFNRRWTVALILIAMVKWLCTRCRMLWKWIGLADALISTFMPVHQNIQMQLQFRRNPVQTFSIPTGVLQHILRPPREPNNISFRPRAVLYTIGKVCHIWLHFMLQCFDNC